MYQHVNRKGLAVKVLKTIQYIEGKIKTVKFEI